MLDSQTLYWVGFDSKKLGSRARQKISSASAVVASSLSLFELRDAQLKRGIAMEHDLRNAFTEIGIAFEPFTADAAFEVGRFGQLLQHDPIDRLIQGQASALGALLYTSDQKLLAQGFDWIVDSTL